jgi:hypothetical protein
LLAPVGIIIFASSVEERVFLPLQLIVLLELIVVVLLSTTLLKLTPEKVSSRLRAIIGRIAAIGGLGSGPIDWVEADATA